jgi:hypothetical protein
MLEEVGNLNYIWGIMKSEIKLTRETLKLVEDYSAESKINKDDLVEKAIKSYISIQKLNKIRKQLKGVARKAGFKSEQDILDRIS